MAERLVDIPLGKLRDNLFANLCRTRCTVSLQHCMDGSLHSLAFSLTKLACLSERHTLLYHHPRTIAHPVAPVGLRLLRLLKGGFQFLEGLCHVILLLNWG